MENMHLKILMSHFHKYGDWEEYKNKFKVEASAAGWAFGRCERPLRGVKIEHRTSN